MQVKEYADGTLVLNGNILEGAKEAYREDRIIEAFALLHAFIEWEMVNLYEQNHIRSGGNLLEIRQLMQNYRFPKLKKELRNKELIEPREESKLGEWYDLNKIIHRLVAYSFHNYPWNRVTREEVKQGFLEGEVLVEMLRKRVFESRKLPP